VSTTNASILQPTIWYRTKSGSSYTFQTYNSTGDLGTPSSSTGYIPPMQAFWVLANIDGTVTLRNSMRSHGDGSANMLKVKAANNSVQPILRLEVQNLANSNSDEAVVYFNANASNGYDAYDSPKMSNANAAIPEIYTVVGNQDLVINGMNGIPSDTELPLGFTTGQSNTFTLKATQISNFDADAKIILKDNLLNTQQELAVGSAYTFSSDAVNTTNRFSLIFKTTAVSTGLQTNNEDDAVAVYRNANGQLVVNLATGIIGQGNVSVYNAVGQKLESKALLTSTTVLNETFTSGVYLIAVSANGKNTTKKVVIN
jgi:hypothetical protein